MLAEALQSTGVSPVEVIGAVFAGLVALAGAGWGGAKLGEARTKRRIEGEISVIPPNPMPIEIVKNLATKDDVTEVEPRLERRIDSVEENADVERGVVREEQGKIHARIDKVAEKVAGIDQKAEQIDRNVRTLLNIQLKKGGKE